MRLCSYTVVNDTGFAPNPFGGYCTLAACTPNHQNINLSQGDWLIGHTATKRGHRLIYAMEVSETQDFNSYYNDHRFERKKPRFDMSWREACGDNIYSLSRDGVWQQAPTLFHDNPKSRNQDIRHPRVYIAEHFYYFGANAPTLPKQFSEFIRDRWGCKCSYPEKLIKAFINWLQINFRPGVIGDPFDFDRIHLLTKISRPVKPKDSRR